MIHPDIYRHFGLEPAEAKIVVMKTNADFKYCSSMIKGVLRVDCPGLSGWDLRQFDWVRAPRQIYPLDELPDWQAEA